MELYNIELEQAILGTVIINNMYFDRALADITKAEHFYAPANRVIWERIEESIMQGVVNDITLKTFFQNNEIIKQVGGVAYLGTLLSRATGVVDIRDYAREVRELWQKRQLLTLMEKSMTELGDKSFDFIAGNLENEMLGLMANNRKKKTKESKEIIKQIKEDRKIGLSSKVISTGFKELDKVLNGGIRTKYCVVIGGRAGIGKAQPLYSNVLTIDGWKKMGDLKIGEKLASIDGEESEVMGIYPQGIKEIFKITFRDGRQAECCGDHLWKVYFHEWTQGKVVTTSRLIEMLNCKRYKNRLWIDEFQGNYGKSEELPIDAWALGALIGDGGLTSGGITFTNSSQEMVNKLKNRLGDDFIVKLRGKKSKIDYSIIEKVPQNLGTKRINRLKENLKKLGLYNCSSYEKFIPEIYLNSNKQNRLNLLQGLLDTDGYVGKGGSITYSTSSKKLADDVIYLAQSLGATTYIATKNPFYTYKGERKAGRLHYVIQISCSTGSEFLSLTDKKKRIVVDKKINKRNTISKIDFIGKEQAQCIKVSHNQSLYITDNFIPTHNTTIAQNIILNNAKAGKTCLFISMEMTEEEVIFKFCSNLTSISSAKLQDGYLDQSEQISRDRAERELEEMRIFINDSPTLRIGEINRIIKMQLEKTPVDMVFIDYIQIIRGDDTKGKNEAQIIKENTTALAGMAKQYDVAIVALAQINRNGVEAPKIQDLKGSGGIEEDAHIVILIHRDVEKGQFLNSGALIVAKNRRGRTCEIPICFDGEFGRFTEDL